MPNPPRARLRAWLVVGMVLACLILTSCTSSGYPADPDGTFDRVSGGTMIVGVSHHPPYVDLTGDEPTGSEVDLVEQFAEQIDADIEWRIGGEEFLMTAMEAGNVDLIIGGLTDRSPWSSKASITRAYAVDTGADGAPMKLVMFVPLGENQMLGELEAFLDEHHPGDAP